MKIIISPAKKMNRKEEELSEITRPVFYEQACQLREELKKIDFGDLKALWNCNEKIAEENQERLRRFAMDQNLTGAVLAYEGIQYQYMAPQVFTDSQWEYVKEHLRILSGLYGILRPQDGVIPYRLEMQARLKAGDCKNLYEFWGDRLYRELTKDDRVILNLASKEYSKAIEKYLEKDVRYITCIFGEEIQGRIKVKATKAKMARGEMVRWLSANQIEEADEVKNFHGLDYGYREEYSSDTEFVFLERKRDKEETC